MFSSVFEQEEEGISVLQGNFPLKYCGFETRLHLRISNNPPYVGVNIFSNYNFPFLQIKIMGFT